MLAGNVIEISTDTYRMQVWNVAATTNYNVLPDTEMLY
jgi:hypothetical protein